MMLKEVDSDILKEYPYKYETHLHTSQASKCAVSTGAQMAKAAKEAGYSGIFVTDHNWGGNTAIDRSLDWETWVHEFCGGYRDAKAWGDANDFDVFFGYEAGFNGTEFLIYGVDEEWMAAHPELWNADVARQYELIHSAGGMVIHAHPYREESYIPKIRLFPEYVDGVEGINATHSSSLSKSHNDPLYDDRAVEYAILHNLPMTAGSDVHSVRMFGGGVAFRRRIKSVEDYINAVLKGEDYILTNGEKCYIKEW